LAPARACGREISIHEKPMRVKLKPLLAGKFANAKKLTIKQEIIVLSKYYNNHKKDSGIPPVLISYATTLIGDTLNKLSVIG